MGEETFINFHMCIAHGKKTMFMYVYSYNVCNVLLYLSVCLDIDELKSITSETFKEWQLLSRNNCKHQSQWNSIILYLNLS